MEPSAEHGAVDGSSTVAVSNSSIISSNQDEIKLYEELQGFLQSDRFDVRLAATDAVYQLATSNAATSTIQQFGLLPLVIKNCSYSIDDDDETAPTSNAYKSALQISINSCKN